MSLSLGGNQAIAEKIVCDSLVCENLTATSNITCENLTVTSNITCENLTATSIMISPSFSQYAETLGSLASPSAVFPYGINYVAGVNKYVFYIVGPATTIPISQFVDVLGLPPNFAATNTINGTVEWILSGASVDVTSVSVYPFFTNFLSIVNNTTSLSPESFIRLTGESTIAPQFSVGTSILKFVVTLTKDI